MPLLLTESDVAVLLTVEDCIGALEAAFRAQAAGKAVNHPRRRIHAPDGTFHTMEAADLAAGRMAIKTYASFRSGARFLVLLHDANTGELLALIEADRLGQIRTGAATGVATRHLAREDASTLGLIGAGWQAETQALAVAAVRPLREVRVFSRDPERRETFAKRLSDQIGVPVEPVATAEAAATGAEVILTATTSRTPVLLGEWLAPGTHINVVGANALTRAEVDIAGVKRADRVVVDSLEQCRMEAGDLLAAVEARRFRWEQARELYEVVAGRWPGREGADEITLFKSVGIALEDVAAASLVYDRARERGLGTETGLWRA
jgi:ornithine cyclodeaminase/alanine dehydrogenase-like protein (mu-crystallin family)